MWRMMHGPGGECRCSLLGAGSQEPLGALPSLGMQPGEQGWSWQDTAAPAGDGAWPSTERKVASVGSTALNRQANTCYTDLWAKSLSLKFSFWKYIIFLIFFFTLKTSSFLMRLLHTNLWVLVTMARSLPWSLSKELGFVFFFKWKEPE